MSLEVASLHGLLSLQDNATSVLRAFNRDIDQTESKMVGVGRGMQSLGLAISAFTTPLVAFGVAGSRVAADFEGSMAEISARAGVVGTDLQMISDFALKMGADTSFSAQQAADAFLQLLTSGQSATEAMSTLPAVLDAAAASGEDLGQTADMVTDILAAFGLGVDHAQQVVDALARGAGASSATMASLGQGIGNVGNIAHQFGLSVEETVAILASFAENGIKGAEAGTQLKSMLTNMTRQTDTVTAAWARLGTSMFDAMGNARPIAEVLQDIRRGLQGMSDEERINTIQDLAGSFGQAGLAALTAGAPMEAMLKLMQGSASAATVAAARLNTFDGRVEALKGSIQTLQIKAMTPFNNALRPLIEQVTKFVNQISEWVEANPDLTATIINVVGALASLGGVLVTVGTAMRFAPDVGAGLKIALSGLLSPIGLLITATGLLAAAFATNFGGIRDTINVILGSANPLQTLLDNAKFYIDKILSSAGSALQQLPGVLSAAWQLISGAVTQFWNNSLAPIVGVIFARFTEAVQQLPGILGAAWQIISGALNTLWTEKLAPIAGALLANFVGAVNQLPRIAGDAWNVISGALNTLWTEKLAPIAGALLANVVGGIGQLPRVIGDAFGTVKASLLKVFYDNLSKPIGDALASIPTDTFVSLTLGIAGLAAVFAVTRIVATVEALVAAVQALGVASLIANIVGLAPMAGVILLIGGLLAAYATNFAGFKDFVTQVGDTLRAAATAAGQLWYILQQIANGNWSVVLNAINSFMGGANQRNIDRYGDLGDRIGKGGGSNKPADNDWWYGKDLGFPKPTVPQGGWGGNGGLYRAAGGPVRSGMPYIVGERGMELFVPSTSGTVVPNYGLDLSGAPPRRGGQSEAQRRRANELHTYGGGAQVGELHMHFPNVTNLSDPRQREEIAVAVLELIVNGSPA